MNLNPANISRIIFNNLNNFSVWFLRLVYYPLNLKYNSVDFKKVPTIRGKFSICNYGSCKFGRNLIFNNSFRSNPMGLTKHSTIFIQKYAKLSIDDFSGFSGVSIYCSNEILIGKNLNCGGSVSIWDTDFHPLDYLERRKNTKNIKTAPINIGNDVFIGANSIILKGVSIGDRAIIGAGSVVTKKILSDQLWAGNPAVLIRDL